MDMPHSALITDQWLTIWSYVPTDFSVPVVSLSWNEDWAALWATLSSLSLDFRSSNYATAVRIVAAARPPLPPAGEHGSARAPPREGDHQYGSCGSRGSGWSAWPITPPMSSSKQRRRQEPRSPLVRPMNCWKPSRVRSSR